MNYSRGILLVLLGIAAAALLGQTGPDLAKRLPHQVVSGWPDLPMGWNFGETASVDINSRGHVFVFHRGPHPLLEFTPAGKFVREIGEGLFISAHGLRIDKQDNIWAVDVGGHMVVKFNPQGRVRLVLGSKGRPGEDDASFNQPTDVGFSASGDIFVCDGYGNSRVMKFSKDGRFLKSWGRKGTAPGQFDLPHAIVVDKTGKVYVGDRENRRIQIFDSEGNFLRQWSHLGSPWGLYIIPEPAIYMTDGYAGRLVKLDVEGNVLGTLGSPGKLRGHFSFPHHLAVDSNENIYVAEILNWRIQKFSRR